MRALAENLIANGCMRCYVRNNAKHEYTRNERVISAFKQRYERLGGEAWCT